jgi:C-terminal processing protease CtpA/Prc
VLPIAAYESWKGVRIEGKGVEPDVEINWSFEDAVAGRDRQLDYALSVFKLYSRRGEFSEASRSSGIG